MSIALRLSRGGSKKRPYYRVVVADTRSPRDGKYLEQIGTYNPLLAKDDDNRVRLVEERARYWLGVGAQPSDRVARLLDKAGIAERKPTSNPSKGEPGKKAKDRAEERATKLAEAEEAAKTAAAAPEPEPEPEASEPEVGEPAAETAAPEPEATEPEAAEPAEAEADVEASAGESESQSADINEATPNGDAGDTPGGVDGESSQQPAEG